MTGGNSRVSDRRSGEGAVTKVYQTMNIHKARKAVWRGGWTAGHVAATKTKTTNEEVMERQERWGSEAVSVCLFSFLINICLSVFLFFRGGTLQG